MKIRSMAAATAAALALLAQPATAAHIYTYTSDLSGAAEAPANASPGTGSATVVLDEIAMTMQLTASFTGLMGNVTAAHIHCCTAAMASGTAGVATQLPSFSGFPAGGTSGVYDMTFDMTDTASWNASFITNNGGTTTDAFAALMAGFDGGMAYLNIHTSAFPGGEIRGFPVSANAVPEPQTLALALVALAGVGLARRRA